MRASPCWHWVGPANIHAVVGFSLILAQLLLSGCTRQEHVRRADTEAYQIVAEKAGHAPWQSELNIEPDPRSRFYDQHQTVCPQLPSPNPRLYAYPLPQLSGDDRIPDSWPTLAELRSLSDAEIDQSEHSDVGSGDAQNPSDERASGQYDSDGVDGDIRLRVQPIPEAVWDSLPSACLVRMFEFQTVVDEYRRTFQEDPSLDQWESATTERLGLSDLVELALLNSREYQTQKENLYRAALGLTLQRYDYELTFLPRGNGTSVSWAHQRAAGQTVNALGTPTAIGVQKLTRSGADLLTRFANDVVLTFNGPSGFTANVGSELLFEVSQAVLQRDIIFEQLTQAEREVIYAARDYGRFRRRFFRDLAGDYYQLLLQYRGIEIDSQDFFSNLRAFEQGRAEYQAGRLPRIQVDQFEQTALRSRRSLIDSCNGLERALDNLKFTIGLPPELPIDLDLRELEVLTMRDTSTVTRQLVARARREISHELSARQPDLSVLLNSSIKLTRRLLDLAISEEKLGETEWDTNRLQQTLAQLQADESRILVEENQRVLAVDRRADPPVAPVRLFRRTMDLVDVTLLSIRFRLRYLERLGAPGTALPPTAVARKRELRRLQEDFAAIVATTDDAVKNRELEQIPSLTNKLEQLLAEVEAFDETVAREIPQRTAEEIIAGIRELSRETESVGSNERDADKGGLSTGLRPIEISHDDALLTALNMRWDLTNERERLADDWRQIKLAADELRSVLNLSASHQLRTRSDVNRPFHFTFDDSQTRLGLALDTPLNRYAQRNNYRNALINYHRGVRSLQLLEDRIKLDVRDNLRQLELDRTQYDIAVASAALAYERVVSIRLQLQLGIENVAARDFLEAQQAYTTSLSTVAREHIGYLNDRIDLFFNLEQLDVDGSNFWHGLYDDNVVPQVNLQLEVYQSSPYGDLPDVWYSDEMLQMLMVPVEVR